MQPDETGKLPTISEDDSSSKTKVNKPKPTKKEKATEKSKAKESRNGPNLNNSSLSNGDTSVEGIQVAVVRGQQRTNVDSLELTQFTKSKDSDSNTSPFSGKHAVQPSKSLTSMKTSISNKDIKNAKNPTTESRNSSGATVSSETYSTDL